jgi:hypothetical protein
MTVHVFAGADGRFVLYEDDGETTAYQQGHSVRTPFVLHWRGDSLNLTIGPAEGDPSVGPSRRAYTVQVHGIAGWSAVEVAHNGQRAAAADGAQTADGFVIALPDVEPGEAIELRVAVNGLAAPDDAQRITDVRALLHAFRLDTRVKMQIDLDRPRLLCGELARARYPLTAAQQQALHQAMTN